MKPTEIIGEILKLPATQARSLLREAAQCLDLKQRNSIRPGQKVKFKTKHNVVIEGKVDRVNPKNVVVTAQADRYGNKTPVPVRWTVSPSLLEVVE